jgi:carboxyl-terminal processing protease
MIKQSFTKRSVARLGSRLGIVVIICVAFAAGNFTGFAARPVLAQRATPSEFNVFWEAWDLVVENFVDRERVDVTAMTYGAIQGMLAALGDQNHTVFFSPEEAERQAGALEGSFEGIGAYVNQEDGEFVIVSAMRGSPAEAAGILSGDIVLTVDGQSITGMEEWEVISLIRGPAGTEVVLTVLHPEADSPEEITIVRGRINIESVLWSRIPGTDLAYIQLTQFSSDTSRDLRTALGEINRDVTDGAPVQGIMLDLRNNPGGYLQEALRVADQFLPIGDVILHEKDAEGRLTTYRVESRTGQAREVALVVLVNGGSASAAEILAGALQENARAKIVGMPTVGTGTVLRPYTLSDGSVIRLGVTNWLTPNYALIKGQGIQPDVPIEQEAAVQLIDALTLRELDAAAARTHPDRQFQAALLSLTMRDQAQPPTTTQTAPTTVESAPVTP